MAHIRSDVCEMQLNGVSEVMDLLQIDVETDVVEDRPCREDAPFSRNVLRKQRNWERQLAAKKSKRKEEKQRRKLHREQESGARADNPQFTKRVMKAITKERLAEAQSTGLKLCVDLSMTDSMSDKEISRLAGQLRRLYGSNKKAARPFHLLLTDLREDSRVYRECLRMNDGFLNYMMEITEDSCLDLFPSETIVYLTPDAEEAKEPTPPTRKRMMLHSADVLHLTSTPRFEPTATSVGSTDNEVVPSTSMEPEPRTQAGHEGETCESGTDPGKCPKRLNDVERDNIVRALAGVDSITFLQALETVDADKVYVLGGLVDESIQKKLSFSRARDLSVQTARLPIDEYMVKKDNVKNFHSKILAVNQVFDILVTFCNTGSWTEALQAWFPQGKGYVVARGDSLQLPFSPTQT